MAIRNTVAVLFRLREHPLSYTHFLLFTRIKKRSIKLQIKLHDKYGRVLIYMQRVMQYLAIYE